MLRNKYATAVDKSKSCFLLKSLVIPGTCELNIHCYCGANALCAKVEGCVTGHNLCECECTNVTHLSLVSCDLAVSDHLVELHTCCNTCQESALIDGSKCIVEVGETCCVSLCTCCVAELYVRILLCSLHKEGLVTEAVSKDYVTTVNLNEFNCCIVAICRLGNLSLLSVLNAHILTCCNCSVHEVLVVGRVLIVKEDETNLNFCLVSTCCACGSVCVSACTASCKSNKHQNCKKSAKNSFHCNFLLKKFIIIIGFSNKLHPKIINKYTIHYITKSTCFQEFPIYHLYKLHPSFLLIMTKNASPSYR